MARTGLRMMPTFPSSPLRFRTAGFPQYGSKAGLSDGAFPEAPDQRVSWFASVLRVARSQKGGHVQCRGPRLGTSPPFERLTSLCPRGPRSGPGCSVPIHQRLLAPSAPLAGTSRFPCKAGYTRRLRCTFRPRQPASGSVLSLFVPSRHVALICPRGVRRLPAPSVYYPARFALIHPLPWIRHSQIPHDPLHVGSPFRGFLVHLLAATCRVARPPLADPTRLSAGWISHCPLSPRVGAPLPAKPTRAFTSELSTSRSPFPLSDMTTVASGHLHRQDFHLLERQLASLHRGRGEGAPL
jgi:hypothetical protein